MLKIITINGIKYLVYFCYYFSSINGIQKDTTPVVYKNFIIRPDSTLSVMRVDTGAKTFGLFRKGGLDSSNHSNSYTHKKGWQDFKFNYVVIKRVK